MLMTDDNDLNLAVRDKHFSGKASGGRCTPSKRDDNAKNNADGSTKNSTGDNTKKSAPSPPAHVRVIPVVKVYVATIAGRHLPDSDAIKKLSAPLLYENLGNSRCFPTQ